MRRSEGRASQRSSPLPASRRSRAGSPRRRSAPARERFASPLRPASPAGRCRPRIRRRVPASRRRAVRSLRRAGGLRRGGPAGPARCSAWRTRRELRARPRRDCAAPRQRRLRTQQRYARPGRRSPTGEAATARRTLARVRRRPRPGAQRGHRSARRRCPSPPPPRRPRRPQSRPRWGCGRIARARPRSIANASAPADPFRFEPFGRGRSWPWESFFRLASFFILTY